MESNSCKHIGKYDIYRTLGKGGTCKVKLGRNRDTGETVAVKIMSDELDEEDL
jgi:serine/threonine protein kinase